MKYSNRFLWSFLIVLSSSFASSTLCLGQQNQSELLLNELGHLRNASCQIVINGSDVCTGVLLNSTNESQINYILSAAHCISDTSQIESIAMTFGGHPPLADEHFTGITWSTSFGIEIIAIDYQQDYVLYELLEIIPMAISPYFLGWDINASNPAFGVTYHYSDINTQMPALKRTSIDISSFSFPPDYKPDLETMTNGFWKVPSWTSGITDVGASGAGLIDHNENYLGGLTGSTVSTNDIISDYFFRFDLAYSSSEQATALQFFLDPQSLARVTGAYFYDLFKTSLFNSFDTLHSIENISTTNTVEISVSLVERTLIRGIYVVLGDLNVGLGSDLTIKVFENGVSIFNKSISWTSLNENAENFIDFDTNISLAGPFELRFSSNSEDQFEQAELLIVTNENSIMDFNTLDMMNNATQKIGIPMITFLADKDIYDAEPSFELTFFPNPSSDFVFIAPASDLVSVEVFDLKGQQIYLPIQLRYNELIVDVASVPKGIYAMRVINDKGQSIRRKFLKN